MASRIAVLAGTTKGAFLIESTDSRENWTVRGPFCDGWPINHMSADPETGTIWAAGGGEWHGAGVWRSDDMGETWSLSLLSNGTLDTWLKNDPDMRRVFGRDPAPEAPFNGKINTFWVVQKVGNRVYAGAKPASLFASDDMGQSWSRVDGLLDHPSAAEWQPGAAGLVLHTVLGDDETLIVGISAAGVFASEDGGATWEQRNRRTNQATIPNPITGECGHDVGLCVHNMVRAPDGKTLYMQNHHGVFRSRDDGRHWDEITEGLPSSFGFPIAVNPNDPQMIFVFPLTEFGGRFPPEGKATVWRSDDAGDNWKPMRGGLPDNCFFTVLRQAMATDGLDQAGLYFGTNSGSVFASFDSGENWSEIARHLPTVLGIEVLQRG